MFVFSKDVNHTYHDALLVALSLITTKLRLRGIVARTEFLSVDLVHFLGSEKLHSRIVQAQLLDLSLIHISEPTRPY